MATRSWRALSSTFMCILRARDGVRPPGGLAQGHCECARVRNLDKSVGSDIRTGLFLTVFLVFLKGLSLSFLFRNTRSTVRKMTVCRRTQRDTCGHQGVQRDGRICARPVSWSRNYRRTRRPTDAQLTTTLILRYCAGHGSRGGAVFRAAEEEQKRSQGEGQAMMCLARLTWTTRWTEWACVPNGNI